MSKHTNKALSEINSTYIHVYSAWDTKCKYVHVPILCRSFVYRVVPNCCIHNETMKSPKMIVENLQMAVIVASYIDLSAS